MFQRGLQTPHGPQIPGLQNLMDRLRKRRQEQLDRYDLGSALEDIKKKLDEVIRTERAGIERQVPDAGERAKKLEPLDQLPPDPAGRIKQLQDYNFTDPEAERLFQELMQQLQQQMLQPFMQGMKQSLQNMSADDLRRMREMMRDLNQMLRQRAEGDEPDFDAFKQKWGQNFPGVESLDELLEQLGRQAGQLQSLLDSMSPGQRRQLQEMMSSLFMKDERLEAEMAQLAMHLDQLGLTEEFRRRYDFRGDDDVTMREAMKLMDELQQMEELERQLRRVQSPDDLDKIDPIDVEKLLGEESAKDLERLKELAKKLEEAGYLERKGDRLELTARAIRKLGDKALKDIFATLKRDRFGRHNIERRGAGGDPTDEAKRYEFGDPFLLDLKKTLMNAVERNGAGTPVRLS
ncbi:MAG: VWA domain-containing protein, partial [Candidatus Rokuibacteriota bacterium]